MFVIRLSIFCVIIAQMRGEKLEKENFDLNSVIGNLFPNLHPGATGNPSANYPGAPTNYPINGGQASNPQGNIWNNGNGNPGVNYPANSQYYPGNGIQYPQNTNNWNRPGTPAGLPNNGIQGNYQNPSQPNGVWNKPGDNVYNVQGRPQYPGSGSNWNGANSNYPPNGQTLSGGFQNRPNPAQGYYGQNPNVNNYPGYNNNQYPNNNNNNRLQKLNPNWNNGAVNPSINYLGNTQTYPANGIQVPNGVPQNWNQGNGVQNYQAPGQMGLQNNQNQIRAPGNTFGGYPNEGQGFGQQTGFDQRGPAGSPYNSRFRDEAVQYRNQSGLTDEAASTDKAAILGSPVIISNITTPDSTESKSDKTSAETKTQCVQDCPTSTTYDPVCGSNNVTYFNQEKFDCAIKCGTDVTVLKKGACSEDGVKE